VARVLNPTGFPHGEGSQHGIEEAVKRLLATECAEHAPPELKDRLRRSIRTIVLEQADVTVEWGLQSTAVEASTTRVEPRP
jgi:hypothetical protein